jgi:hypothetical protein
MVLGSLLALWGGMMAAAPVFGQDDEKPSLLISDNAREPKKSLGRELFLRPTVDQNIYLFIKNPNAAPKKYLVELIGKVNPPLAKNSIELTVGAGQSERVPFEKLTAGAPMATKPAVDGGAPPPRPLLDGPPFQFQVKVTDPASKTEVKKDVDVKILRPRDYLTITDLSWDGVRNEFVVGLKAKEGSFSGPPCHVRLDLDRIPELVKGSVRGVREDDLTVENPVLTLRAQSLQFTSQPQSNRFVYLNVDGYNRAFIFETRFVKGGPATPKPIDKPSLRIASKRFSLPGDYALSAEVDNVSLQDLTSRLEVGIDLDETGAFKTNEVFAGLKQQRLFVTFPTVDGALQLKPEVKDWSVDRKFAVLGTFKLRAAIITSKGTPMLVLDGDNPSQTVKEVKEVFAKVVFDDSPPEKVKLVNLPQKINIGEDLIAQAQGEDKESGIKEVNFYEGKPDAKGDPPKTTAIPAQFDEKTKTWRAKIEGIADEKGDKYITAQFVNNVGLSKLSAPKLVVVQEKVAVAVSSSIKGTVVRSGAGPQKDLEVQLKDDKGKVKDTVKTDNKGEFEFKNVAPGAYTIVTERRSNLTGMKSITVVAGKETPPVAIELDM